MWLVFTKEIKELLRDRKTLFFMVALPLLLFPLIFGGVAYFSGKVIKEAQEKTLNYAVIGAQYAPEFAQRLAQRDDLALVEAAVEASDEEGIKALVESKTVDFVLVIPDNFSNDILDAGQLTLTLYLNDAGLNNAKRRVDAVMDDIAEANQRAAFAALNVTEEQQVGLLEPILIEKISTADKREDLGEKIGGLVPYI
ncbi:MAG: ABC transporter permease, partial [Glaciecola sp.]